MNAILIKEYKNNFLNLEIEQLNISNNWVKITKCILCILSFILNFLPFNICYYDNHHIYLYEYLINLKNNYFLCSFDNLNQMYQMISFSSFWLLIIS